MMCKKFTCIRKSTVCRAASPDLPSKACCRDLLKSRYLCTLILLSWHSTLTCTETNLTGKERNTYEETRDHQHYQYQDQVARAALPIADHAKSLYSMLKQLAEGDILISLSFFKVTIAQRTSCRLQPRSSERSKDWYLKTIICDWLPNAFK